MGTESLQTFRMVWRFTLIVLMTAVLVSLRFAGMPLAFVSPQAERRFRRGIVRAWGWCFRRICGIRLRIQGRPPAPPFFMVSNHLGYVDSFVLAGILGPIFVARADVENWPGAGIVAKSINTIFIDRAKMRDTMRVNREIEDELRRGSGVVVYAEARTSSGRDVRPFKSALLEPAAAPRLPVYYCTIYYETFEGDPPASDVVCWHTEIGFFDHAKRFLRLRGFDTTVTFGAEPIVNGDRKQLAEELWHAVRRQFVPIKQAEEPGEPVAAPRE